MSPLLSRHNFSQNTSSSSNAGWCSATHHCDHKHCTWTQKNDREMPSTRSVNLDESYKDIQSICENPPCASISPRTCIWVNYNMSTPWNKNSLKGFPHWPLGLRSIMIWKNMCLFYVCNVCIFFAGASEGLRFALYLAYIHIRSWMLNAAFPWQVTLRPVDVWPPRRNPRSS